MKLDKVLCCRILFLMPYHPYILYDNPIDGFNGSGTPLSRLMVNAIESTLIAMPSRYTRALHDFL